MLSLPARRDTEALGQHVGMHAALRRALRASKCMRQVLVESLAWMAKAVQEFGLGTTNVQLLIGWGKEDLGSPNAAVRTAATQFLASAHRQLGPGLADMIKNDVKPALWTGLEEAFKANPQQQVIVRGVRCTRHPT